MLISIVVPFFNEEDNILHFYDALCEVAAHRDESFEFLFVDDGSSDRTPLILTELAERDARVTAFILARNFGHQTALTCGLDHARGDAVVTMDDGYEVVQTVRLSTANVGAFKKWTSKLYYRFINSISQVQITEGGSDFRLIDRKVADSLLLFREKARFIRGLVSDIGYRQTQITFRAPARYAGESKFSLRKMVRFALDGITSYSTLPLRMALYVGVLSGIGSLLLIIYVLLIKYYFLEAVPGWATLAVMMLLFGGLQLIFLGIIGEYIGRIFAEVKDRPLYWLRGTVNQKTRH